MIRSVCLGDASITHRRKTVRMTSPRTLIRTTTAGLLVVVALASAGCDHPGKPAAEASPSPSTQTTVPAWASLPATAPSSAAPVYNGPPLTEQAACKLLIPVLRDAVDLVLALSNHPDGSTVDRAKLDGTMSALVAIHRAAPEDMRDDITNQVHVLEAIDLAMDGHNQTIDNTAMKASGIALATRCRKWATR